MLAKKGLTVCSAYFCHLNHFYRSSRLLSIFISTTFVNLTAFVNSELTSFATHINHLAYVTTDEVTTFVNRSAHFCRPHTTFLVLSMNDIQSHFEENCFYLIIWFLVNQILPTPICLVFPIRETT